jgi:repressor LexA
MDGENGMSTLTRRQREVLEFLLDYLAENGYPPTIREIRSAFRLSSNRGVVDHLAALERKGFIRRGRGSSRAIEILHGSGPDAPADLPRVRAVRYPVAGRIEAGRPAPAAEGRDGSVVLDGRLFGARGDFLLEVKGDSMRDDHIVEGDLVVVKRVEKCRNGDTVVALVDGEATVKRYYRRREDVILQPANPAYEPIVFTKGDARSCSLLGKVIGVIRRYPLGSKPFSG